MKTINHANLNPFISAARLNTYRTFFTPTDDTALLGAYLWNKDVASSFFPLLQILEVSLRNAIHNEAQSIIGPFWFDNIAVKKNRNNPALNRAYTQHFRKIADVRADIQRTLLISTPTEDGIISSVTFGFWTNLFSPVFDVNRNPRALWPQLLKPVFPNVAKGYLQRHDIQTKLLTLKTFRNKAFHHEPVWNIGRPNNINDAILKLLTTRNLMIEIIKSISNDCFDLISKSGYIDNISRVCSLEYLAYLQNPGSNELTLSQTKRELRSILNQKRGTTDIIQNGKIMGKLIGC